MDLGKVIYDILSTDVNVISLVGDTEAGDGKRIFPLRASYKETLPLIIYNVENVTPTNDKDGVSRLDVVGFEINIYADSYSVIASLSGFVRDALDGFSGTNNGVVVDRMIFTDLTDGFDEAAQKPITIQEYDARIKL